MHYIIHELPLQLFLRTGSMIDTIVRISWVDYRDCAVVGTAEQNWHIDWTPLDFLNGAFMVYWGVDTALFCEVPDFYSVVCWTWSKNCKIVMIQWETENGICVTAFFIFLWLVSEFLRLLFLTLDLTSKDHIRLNGLHQVQIPYLNLWQKTWNYCVVSFHRLIGVDGSQTHSQPLQVQGKRRKHYFMVNKQIVAALFVNIYLETGVLFLLYRVICTTLPATMSASVSLIR